MHDSYVEGVSFSLELSAGVDLVSHDPGDGLLHVLHPLGHLVVPHVVHLLDKLVVLLPESHLGALSLLSGSKSAMNTNVANPSNLFLMSYLLCPINVLQV